MQIATSLLPIFLIIALGGILARCGFLSPEMRGHLNKAAYWIGMPALLFRAVATARITGDRPLLIAGALLAGTGTAMIVAYLGAALLRLPRSSIGTFVQASFRGNLAFLAFPLSIFVFSQPGAPASAAEMTPIVALAIAPVMIVYAVAAVVVLIVGHPDLARGGKRALIRQVLVNPHILAIGAGLLATSFSLRLPEPLLISLKLLGGLAIPAALLGIGASIATARLGPNLTPAVVSAGIKIIVTPLTVFALTRFMPMSSVDAGVAVVLAAAPTAAVSFVMATQLQGDPELASSAILLSTLGSIVSLGLALNTIV
ncbi:MAG: AEC family transporter [Verrucomicrobia bacterium]|nr:MAG: AEC family transporter [Verrucomicrobiota bacterium]